MTAVTTTINRFVLSKTFMIFMMVIERHEREAYFPEINNNVKL